MYKKIPVLAAALFMMSVLAACGGTPTRGGSAATEPAPSQYLIGPGDSLQVFVWDHTDLTTTVQVRPDGRISTPLVEDLQAAGKTPTDLARDVERVLGQYVRSPVVTVIVQTFVGESGQQVRVVGQAVGPRTLQYRQGMRVLDVVIAAGGLSQFAAGNRARIVRGTGAQQTEIRVRLDDLLNDGRIDQNVPMQPGEVLIIPQSRL
jgi:polysaccharide export outer membrane protein